MCIVSSFHVKLPLSENITRLDLRTGTYNTLCYVPGYCLNACAVSPATRSEEPFSEPSEADYQIYCQTRSQPSMFVRVNCATATLALLRDASKTS